MQKIIEFKGQINILDDCFKHMKNEKILLVCGNSIEKLQINNYFNSLETRLGVKVVKFKDFSPNPSYESVIDGVRIFIENKCKMIVAVGGGSAIDVAKCIKLFSNLDHNRNYLKQELIPNSVQLLAMPTTAGSGSESTKFAVIYYKGEKQSVSDESCIPSTVILDEFSLNTLPEYQKKSTMLDALCHAMESYWSVNSTEESRLYSKEAIGLILANYNGYLMNTNEGNIGMMKAANIAGKAINISQTTAGHAMCYKLTSLFGISHGHAAALCVSKLFPYMVNNMDKCIDSRGEEFLGNIFNDIAKIYGCKSPIFAAKKFDEIISSLKLDVPKYDSNVFKLLVSSVNSERLKNNPIELDNNAIEKLYYSILMK